MQLTKQEWTLLTNHGCLLSLIAKNSRRTIRELADMVGISQRTILKIVGDLEAGGYIVRHKEGRRNRYTVNPELSMRCSLEGSQTVGDMLLALGWAPRENRRGSSEKRVHRTRKVKQAKQ